MTADVFELDPGVAALDQHHAEAVELLRGAKQFVLLVSTNADEDDEVAVSIRNHGTFAFVIAARAAYEEALAEVFAELVDKLEDEDEAA